MKLYEVPRNSWVIHDKDNNVVHLPAWQEVEVLDELHST